MGCCFVHISTMLNQLPLRHSTSITLIRPNLEYASIVWDPYLVRDRKVLEDVQKFACRVCTKDWHTDYQCLLDGLHIPSLELRRRAMRLCFMYKLIDNNTQILPTSQRNCPYTTRSTHSKQLEKYIMPFLTIFKFLFPPNHY